MKTKRLCISLREVQADDPQLVAVYGVAQNVYDMFEELLQQVGMVEIPGTERERESVRRWTMYLGTLAGEMLAATMLLSVADMPRGQIVLNRDLFEYFVRNQWMMRHPSETTRLLDSLHAFVEREMRRSTGLFDADTRRSIKENYEAWKSEHEDLDKKVSSETTFKAMAEDVLGSRFDREYFWSYGFPSIIGHGKPHGIPDVLRPLGEGRVTRSVPSVWLDCRVQLADAVGYGLQYATFLGLNYGLDLTTIDVLNARFGEVLEQFGVKPEVVAMERVSS